MYDLSDKLKDKIIMLIKFSDEKSNLESLQQGNLYLNTLEYFHKMEQETKTKGMGDNYEGRHVLADVNFKMYDNETGKLFLSGTSKQSVIKTKEDSEKHILCTSYIDYSSIEIIEQGKDFFKGNVLFKEEEKSEFRKHFGKYALIISFGDFINNIKSSFENQGIKGVGNKVKYSNFSKNYIDRTESFAKNTPAKYLWKDIYFKNQKEYRLVVLNRDSDKPIRIKVDNMSKYSYIMDVDQLFDEGLYIESHFNPQTDIVEYNE
ncbi:hypothetical protein [Clostridium arbusti]|uniref:hypothetical protein n=1 Tax=Clostridium arbusti TaxID=1137848 RepID=UPI000289791B|nr:hypothetical protein [Clostridium arbusti]